MALDTARIRQAASTWPSTYGHDPRDIVALCDAVDRIREYARDLDESADEFAPVEGWEPYVSDDRQRASTWRQIARSLRERLGE